jgi:hypothetical protein
MITCISYQTGFRRLYPSVCLSPECRIVLILKDEEEEEEEEEHVE